MSNQHNFQSDASHAPVYRIRIGGHLGAEWADWFDGMTITPEENGHTLLTGPVADQAALYGLLRKIRDLGVPLLSVTRAKPEQPDAPDAG